MKHFFITITIFSLFSCKSKLESKESKYFEGIVEYKIQVASDSARMLKYFKENIGTAAKAFIKGNMVSRFYYNDNKIIVKREMQNLDSLKLYIWNGDSDTIKVLDLQRANFLSAVSTNEVQAKMILGKKCKGVESIMQLYNSMFNKPIYFTAAYYFDTTIRLRPDLYKDVRYGSCNEIFTRYPFITLGYQEYNNLGHTNFSLTATRIISNKLDDVYFELPKNKILVSAY